MIKKEDLKIVDCTLFYSGGGCYIAYGQILIKGSNYGFYGGIKQGYMILSIKDLNEYVANDFTTPFDELETKINPISFKLSGRTSKYISKMIIDFKKVNGMNKEDNYIIGECERIINYGE